MVHVFGNIIEHVLNLLTNVLLSFLIWIIKQLCDELTNLLYGLIDVPCEFIKSSLWIFNEFIDSFSYIISKFLNLVHSILDDFISLISELLESLKSIFDSILDGISNCVAKVLHFDTVLIKTGLDLIT